MNKIFLSALLLISCNSIQKSYDGVYSGTNKEIQYHLELKSENDFTIMKDTSVCKGKWMLMAIDSILLKCDDHDMQEKMFNGYLIKKDLVLKVKNSNELKLGTFILKKEGQ